MRKRIFIAVLILRLWLITEDFEKLSNHLSRKVTKHSKRNLLEDDKIIFCDDQIAKRFSEYFRNISILNMTSNGYKCPHSSEQDPILKILGK